MSLDVTWSTYTSTSLRRCDTVLPFLGLRNLPTRYCQTLAFSFGHRRALYNGGLCDY